MESILNWFRKRPLRLLGGLIVFVTTGLILFLMLLDIVGGVHNPYLGVFIYMMLPGVLVFGLLLVPLDAWIQHRRERAGRGEYPVINLCDPRQRKIAYFFGTASVIILVVMTVVSYRFVEYGDTKSFCGLVCHKVMIPEYTAYNRSPHANVNCVQCHIGPGAPWFVRSKLSGIPQVYHYTMKDYPRPLPTPVRALRPSRDTCENCHWPERFYGDALNTTISYDQDKTNTRQVTTMLMHVGSGGVAGSGIHSHIVGKVYYLPATENHKEIAWVKVDRADGSSQEFVNPAYSKKLASIRKEHATRYMDCIDCHNRAAHKFVTFENLVDSAIVNHRIDPSIPYIKREAMRAVGEMDKVPTEAQQARVIRRIDGITGFYEREMPDTYKSDEASIRQAVNSIRQQYRDSAFPHMKVDADTYPDWRTHDGCFRCHGTLVAANPKGRDKDIPLDCTLCHTEPVTKAAPHQ